jgi:DNA mismatch repair protein MutS
MTEFPAWAIAEFLHEHPSAPKRCLQRITMNEMSGSLSRIQNYNVAVKELKDTVLLLVIKGEVPIFGIHVAKWLECRKLLF